jgi:ribonuclease J
MAEQARFGISEGIPRSLVQSNGDVVRLAPSGPKIIGNERTGRLVLDGNEIVPANGVTISSRRKLALNGVIVAGVAIDATTSKILDIELRINGVPIEGSDDQAGFIEDAVFAVREAAAKAKGDSEKLREAIRLAIRREAADWTGKKPIVEVMLLKIG